MTTHKNPSRPPVCAAELGLLARLTRLLRHRWQDERSTHAAVPPALLERLRQRVAASERRHSGEVRICVEACLPPGYAWRAQPTTVVARARALALFGKLRVWDTANNNGVLIYLLLAERRLEIVADRGLNAVVSPEQWQAIAAHMSQAFAANQYEDGLTQALSEVSALLVLHFAQDAGTGSSPGSDANELPDAPVLI